MNAPDLHNPPQTHILDIPATGPVLIEANAGTGKTYTLVHLYLRLLLEKQLLPSQILLLTFTNAATDELRVRLRELLRTAHAAMHSANPAQDMDPTLHAIISRFHSEHHRDWLKWCLVSFDQAAIFTINGFCQRILEDYNHLCGSPALAELDEDNGEQLQNILADYWRLQEAEIDPSLLRFVHQAGIRIRHVGKTASDKGLQKLVSGKQNKGGFSDINVPKAPDSKDLAQRFHSLESRWQTDKENLIQKLVDSPISRLTKTKWQSMHRDMEAFFSSGALGGTYLKYFNGLEKDKLPYKKGHDASDYPDDDFFTGFGALYQGMLLFVQAFRYNAWTYASEQFRQRLKTHGHYRYQDQIALVHQAVTATGSHSARKLRQKITQQWPVAFLDEFQDTDQQQFEIFSSCYLADDVPSDQLNLVMVGDPKQAIYGFRGADVFVYEEAKNRMRQWQGENHQSASEQGKTPRILALTTNWRSTPMLIDFVNACFSADLPLNQNSEETAPPFVLPHIGYQASCAPDAHQTPQPLPDPLLSQPVVLLHQKPDASSSTENSDLQVPAIPPETWVIDEIRRLLALADQSDAESGSQDHVLGPQSIAILLPKNDLCLQWYERLLQAGFPATLWSEQKVFETQMAQDVFYLMRAILRPTEENIRAVLLSSFCDFSMDELLRDTETLQSWHAYLLSLDSLWRSQGLTSVLDAVQNHRQLPRGNAFVPWLKRIDGERRVTDFNHLLELLAEEETQGRSGEKLLQWLAENIQAVQSDNHEAAKRRLESDKPGISIMTLHKSKGLQFPVVFMPNLEDCKSTPPNTDKPPVLWPVCHYHRSEPQTDDSRWQAVTDWQTGAEGRISSYREDLSERRRLLYVGMTRAEQRLYLIYQQPDSGLASCVFAPYAQLLQTDDFSAWVCTGNQLMQQTGQGAVTRQITPFDTSQADDVPLAPKRFTAFKRLQEVVQVGSFSRLVSDLGHEAKDFFHEPMLESPELDPNPVTRQTAPVSVAEQFLHFPKGPVAGTCFHEIMEHCPLKNPHQLSENSVVQALEKFGFPVTGIIGPDNQPIDWSQCLRKHAITVCETPLNDTGLRLDSGDEYWPEMEFLLPATRLQAAQVNDWLGIHRKQPVQVLSKEQITGFLGGFIDLIFSHDGRFYVVDYKTNHLGYSVENYLPESLQTAIEAHHYDLQYLLYSAAVVRLLRQHVQDFDYERHFGGVYYLFVRGMGLDATYPQAGVYFNRPEKSLIEAILEVMA